MVRGLTGKADDDPAPSSTGEGTQRRNPKPRVLALDGEDKNVVRGRSLTPLGKIP